MLSGRISIFTHYQPDLQPDEFMPALQKFIPARAETNPEEN
jgi:hypothetical protein